MRWYWRAADGRLTHPAWPTGIEDTPENRQQLERLRAVVGKLVLLGKDPAPHLKKLVETTPAPTDASPAPVLSLGPTMGSHAPGWIAEQTPPLV
ncbi:MAG: hypothetical protein ACREQL_05120, partial [Candidatus Binatia bacterium]